MEAVQQMLSEQWVDLSGGLGLPAGTSDILFSELCRQYTHPSRHYHNLNHLHQIFTTLHTVKTNPANATPLHLAIFYHDAVYEPQATTNEVRSAELMLSAFSAYPQVAPHLPLAYKHILATRHHKTPTHPDSQLLLDLDLAILGGSWEQYQVYSEAIRQEYTTIPDDIYRAGRVAILQRFLSRPQLFLTPNFGHLEVSARANLQKEVTILQHDPFR